MSLPRPTREHRCGPTSATGRIARVLTVVLAGSLGAAHAATLKVDRRGQTPGAYASLAQAVAAVQAGDTIELVPGSGPYRETLEIEQGGTDGAPIVVEGHGELVTGFDPFQFTWNPVASRWEYVLPPALPSANPNVPSLFRHLVTYRGQRLLMNHAGTRLTSEFATLSSDGLTLILGNASPTDGWEIGTRKYVVRVASSTTGTPRAWHHVYRNLRVSGSTNDGFSLKGAGTDLRFENIESFHNFDEGFSAHDGIHCAVDGARFWGNDNGLYDQAVPDVAVDANNVMAYANLGTGISMRQGVNRLTNSAAWDNGVVNLALGGTFEARSIFTFQNRQPEAPFLAYQENQGQALGQAFPYAYYAFWLGQAATPERQAYAPSAETPVTLAASVLPPFALAYDDWRFVVFNASQISQPSISGAQADPDADGRNNAREFADGTNPLLVDAPVTRVWVEVPDADARRSPRDPGRIEVHRGGPSSGALTVFYAMEGTAVSGADYETPAGFITFAPGATVANVAIDPLASPGTGVRHAVLRVASDPAYRLGPSTGTVTIDGVDLPIVGLETVDVSAAELPGEDGLFRVRRSGSTAQPLTVPVSIGGSATPGSDYAALPNPIEFAVGQSTVDLRVTAIADGIIESIESVQLTLLPGATYRVGGAIGVVEIDGLALPTLSLAATDASASEVPGNPGAFTVSRASVGPALIAYYGVAGTATNGLDYEPLVGGVQLADGSSSAVIALQPIADTLAENTETVVLTLLDDPYYRVGSPSTGTVSIANSAPPQVSLLVTDSKASEAPGNGGSISVSRTGSKTAPLSVALSWSGSATRGVDYADPGSVLVIPAGAGSATIAITPIADALPESTESATLTLQPGSGYVLAGTITGGVDIADVPLPTVSVVASDASASEAAGQTGAFLVTRSGSRTLAMSVAVSLSGTATEGQDYAAVGTTVTIPAGSGSVTVPISPLPDTVAEPTESVVLRVEPRASYTVGAPAQATVSISNVAPP